MKQVLKVAGSVLLLLVKIAIGGLCLLITCGLLASFLLTGGSSRGSVQNSDTNYALTDRYNMFVTNTLSDALDGVLSIPKTYWLNDDDLVAPMPNPEKPISSFFDSHRTPADFPAGVSLSIFFTAEADS